MRHAVVFRIVLAILALLAISAIQFAWHASAAGAFVPERTEGEELLSGREAFELHCAVCHEVDELASPLTGAEEPARSVIELLRFLAEHGAADPREDLAIAEWLLDTRD